MVTRAGRGVETNVLPNGADGGALTVLRWRYGGCSTATWVPAFAGMTDHCEISAFAGMTSGNV